MSQLWNMGIRNHHAIRKIERDSQKVNVWRALSSSEVSKPFFFAEQTVTAATTYLGMLQLYLLPQLQDHQANVLFRQYGAPPDSARIVRKFPDMRWAGHDGPIPLP
jgi:hypothetical protein